MKCLIALLLCLLTTPLFAQQDQPSGQINPDDPRVGQGYRKDQMKALEGIMKSLEGQNINMEDIQKQLKQAEQQFKNFDAGSAQQKSSAQPRVIQRPKTEFQKFQQQQQLKRQQAYQQQATPPQQQQRGGAAAGDGLDMMNLLSGEINEGTIVQMMKHSLPPRTYKLLSVITDKRVTTPLKDINFTGKKLRLMLLLELILAFIMMFVRFSFRKATPTFTRAVLFNIFSMAVFWVMFVAVVPAIVYGNNYLLLLKGLFHSIQDMA